MEFVMKNDNTTNEASRRRFLKNLSTVLGGAAIGTVLTDSKLAVAMAYQSGNQKSLTVGKIFNEQQLSVLKTVCSIVIPKTDTLGAAEVNTHGFIDNQLFYCHTQEEQNRVLALITLIDEHAKAQFSTLFMALTDEQQFDLLTHLDLGQSPFNASERAQFKFLKQLICFGYYTSEVGATQELRYEAFPGGYKGSIPYKKTDASWATGGLFY